MKKFGLYINCYTVKLVDWNTGEIVAEGENAVNDYLIAFEGSYTLSLF